MGHYVLVLFVLVVGVVVGQVVVRDVLDGHEVGPRGGLVPLLMDQRESGVLVHSRPVSDFDVLVLVGVHSEGDDVELQRAHVVIGREGGAGAEGVVHAVGGVEGTLRVAGTLRPGGSTLATQTVQRGRQGTPIELQTLGPTHAILTHLATYRTVFMSELFTLFLRSSTPTRSA